MEVARTIDVTVSPCHRNQDVSRNATPTYTCSKATWPKATWPTAEEPEVVDRPPLWLYLSVHDIQGKCCASAAIA